MGISGRLKMEIGVVGPDGVIRLFGLSPLQEPQGQPQITVDPGTDRHGPTRVVETLSSVPGKDVFV